MCIDFYLYTSLFYLVYAYMSIIVTTFSIEPLLSQP